MTADITNDNHAPSSNQITRKWASLERLIECFFRIYPVFRQHGQDFVQRKDDV